MSDPSEQAPFTTIEQLRAAHNQLAQQREALSADQLPVLAEAITYFVYRATQSGAMLYDLNDRHAAQSLINYWANLLYRAGRELSNTILLPFDQQLAPELPDSSCPYLGLDSFSERERNLFFGRQAQIAEILSRLLELRFLAIVGPSGSGKSSLVRAGIIPALRAGALPGSQSWRYLPPIVPGSQPLNSLAELFRPRSVPLDTWQERICAGLRRSPFFLKELVERLKPIPIVLVIDQFEELFTLVRETEKNNYSSAQNDVQAFVDNLVNLLEAPGPRHTVIITMRSDYEFESRISTIDTLATHFSQGRMQVIPPVPAELREAITGPARQSGLIFEEGVVDLLVNDLAGDPAALPLLQFTLLQLWKQRQRNRITREVYESVGGGRRALEKTAETFFSSLIEQNAETVRWILLELVETRTLGEITSRRIRYTSLYEIPHDRSRIDRMVQAMVAAGLLRLTHGAHAEDNQVELAHEALIRNWPRFIRWLEEERDRRRTRGRLSTAAEQWHVRNHDQGALWLSRTMLADADTYSDLSPVEREFLSASKHVIELQESAEKRQLQRLARQRLALAITTMLALVTALIAFYQYRQAEVGRRILSMQALADKLQPAIQREDFITSVSWLAQHSQPSSFDQALNGGLPAASQSTLHELLQQAILQKQLPLYSQSNANINNDQAKQGLQAAWALLPSNTQLHQVSRGAEKSQLSHPLQLALIGLDHEIHIWQDNDASQTLPQQTARLLLSPRLVQSADPIGLRWSNDTSTLLIIWDNGSAQRVDLQTDILYPEVFQHSLNTANAERLLDAQFSPDDSKILSRGQNSRYIHIWNQDTSLYCSLEHQNVVIAAAWLDNTRIFTLSQDKRLRIWQLTGRQCVESKSIQLQGPVPQLAELAPDRSLALAYEQGTIQVLDAGWDSNDHISSMTLRGHSGSITSLSWNDSRQLISFGSDHTLRTWDMSSKRQIAVLRSQNLGLTQVYIAPSGKRALAIRTYLQTTSDAVDIRREDAQMLYLNDIERARAQITALSQLPKMTTPESRTEDTASNKATGLPILLYDSDIRQLIAQAMPGAQATLQESSTSPSSSVEAVYITPQVSQTTPMALTAIAITSGTPTRVPVITSIPTVSGTQASSRTPSPNPLQPSPNVTIVPTNTLAAPSSAPATDIPVISPSTTALATPSPLPISPPIEAGGHISLQGHTGIIFDARISTNNQWIATASMDGTARIWDMRGQQRTILNQTARVNMVEFNTDSTQLVTASDDNTARIWSVPDGQLLAVLTHTDRVNQAVFSPDGHYIATASRDQSAKLWRVSDAKELCTLNQSKQVFATAFSPDSQRLVIAVGDRTAQIWSINNESCTGQITLSGHTNSVLNVRFSPDGRRVISSSADQTVRVWDAQSGAELFTLRGNNDWVRSPSISEDGNLALAAGKDGLVRVWNLQDGSLRWEAKGAGEMITARFKPGNNTLIATANEDGKGTLWQIDSPVPLKVYTQSGGPVYAAEFSPDGQLLVVAGASSIADVYNITNIP